jgi:hypothetical protein
VVKKNKKFNHKELKVHTKGHNGDTTKKEFSYLYVVCFEELKIIEKII